MVSKHIRWTSFILLFLFTVSISSALTEAVEDGSTVLVENDCPDDYTPILGMQRKDSYGSHLFDAGYDTEYTVCLEEKFLDIEEERFSYTITDQGVGCPDEYYDIFFVHEPDLTDNQPGSHISVTSNSGDIEDFGKFCIKHSGYKGNIRPHMGEPDCDEDEFCHFLFSMPYTGNTHIGWEDWGNNQLWIKSDDEVPRYHLNVSIKNPQGYMEYCDFEEDCNVTTTQPEEGDPDIGCPDDPGEHHIYSKCHRYRKYCSDGDQKEVSLEAESRGELWEFRNWVVDDDTYEDEEITIDMDGNKEAVANFIRAQRELDLNIETGDKGNISMQRNTNFPDENEEDEQTYVVQSSEDFLFKHGDVIELEAVPEEGYAFGGWTGDKDTTVQGMDFRLEEDKELTALFKESNTLTIKIDGWGSVKANGVKECEPRDYECDFEFVEGSQVELEANPYRGWYFDGWEGVQGEEKTITVDLEEDMSIDAKFESDTFCIIKICGPGDVCDEATVRCI